MNRKQKRNLRSILLSLFSLIAVVILGAILGDELTENKTIDKVIWIGLYLIPYLLVGGNVLMKAFRNILKGKVFDENFLMSIATIGAFALGEYAEGVAVMLFYQVGELFENIAVSKSRNAISSLVSLRPDHANLEKKSEDGNEINIEKVDPEDVAIGDIIVILPGEKIPLDGIIIEGETFINTSALTGESVPRRATVGEAVLSGCINEQGKIRVKVTKAFGESTVSKILDMVENASSRKSRTEGFITRFAKYYTPAVVIAAVILATVPPLFMGQNFLEWFERSLVFLVISCPCALVISVPLGFFGGIGASSKNGILVKGSNYLEAIAKVDTVVFDKTGTLTKGVFNVNEIVTEDEVSKESLLALAAYAEQFSNHPIATSIKLAYQEQGEIQEKYILDIKEISGKGVCATLDSGILDQVDAANIADNANKTNGTSDVNVDNNTKIEPIKIYAGNEKLMSQMGIKTKDTSSDLSGTIVYLSLEDKYLGYISISDEVKEKVPETIKRLDNQGIKNTVMLTGDRSEVANDVAKKIGIKTVYSELMPGDKLDKLEMIIEDDKRKKSKDSMVAFIGDGINDAPSLSRADIGIAMGGLGQDAAIEAADIVLMDDDPSKIATVQNIGKKTLRIVRQNIVFALGVKFIVLVLGVFGIANMWLAVFADVGVSIIAIINSMRMLSYKE